MIPVFDLHCDLLVYLAEVAGARPDATGDIGCALPSLRRGGVALQVLAISATGDTDLASIRRQAGWFHRLYEKNPGTARRVASADDLAPVPGTTGLVAALEDLSIVMAPDDPLETGLARFEALSADVGPLAYVSLTHARENRFGGGDATRMGLKDDGRAFLDRVAGRGIPVDLSHASDALAADILDRIDREGLDIPVLASHSNLRRVWPKPRNLPDELAREIIGRGGLIGLNLVRAILHDRDPGAPARHLAHAAELGGAGAVGFGADFFCERQHPDRSRAPFFHERHGDATRYPEILAELERDDAPVDTAALAHGNALRFYRTIWRTTSADGSGT